jgi:hypothetical protein
VVSFTSRPLYPQEKSPLYPLDRRLGGSQNRCGRRREERILPLPGQQLRPLGRTTRSHSLYRLGYPEYFGKVLLISTVSHQLTPQPDLSCLIDNNRMRISLLAVTMRHSNVTAFGQIYLLTRTYNNLKLILSVTDRSVSVSQGRHF